MSKIGKALLFLFFVSFILGVLAKTLPVEPSPYWWTPFAGAAIFWILEIFLDRKLYASFLTLKTTKHGINMGTMILLVLVLLVAINFVAVKRNKKWDLTAEKLNSLSEQTTKLLKGLDDTLEVRAFFREQDSPEEVQNLGLVRHYIGLMKADTNKIDFQIIDPVKRPDLVKQYEVLTSGSVVIKYKGKSTTISDTNGITEEAFANGLLKITRSKNKQIAYLVGHGEISLDNEKNGATFFKKALQDSSYDVAELNLVTQKAIPEGTDVLIVAGPKQALLEPEIKQIVEFTKKGGRLFVAADPGVKHNINNLLHSYGLVFTNKYILDQFGQQIAGTASLAIGTEYSPTSDITKDLKEKRITLFQLASPLERDPKAEASIVTDDVVKTSPASFTRNEITSSLSIDSSKEKPSAQVVMMTSNGKIGDKDFSIVALGDSDVLSNQLFFEQYNRDLIMNTVSYLAKDQDLISIRPKVPMANRLNITPMQAQLLFFGVYFAVPVVLLVMSAFVWWRRRGA